MLFRSRKNENLVIEIQERDNGLYFFPAAEKRVAEDMNSFASIDEMEKVLGDELEMVIPLGNENE